MFGHAKHINKKERKPKKSFAQEFREFALKGSVFDMAVGVVIGTAVSNIIKSFISDLIMPSLGLLTSGKDFSQMKYVFGDSAILYGDFIQNIVNFFITALSIFLVVKFINFFRTIQPVLLQPGEQPEEQKDPPTELELLIEIRDLLKERATEASADLLATEARKEQGAIEQGNEEQL